MRATSKKLGYVSTGDERALTLDTYACEVSVVSYSTAQRSFKLK